MTEMVVPMPPAGAAPFPPVCVGCGRPARWARRVRVLGESSGYLSMVGESALDNMERMARGPGVVRLPVCWRHRWIVPPSVVASAEGTVVRLSGVCDTFVAAVRSGRKHAEPGAAPDRRGT